MPLRQTDTFDNGTIVKDGSDIDECVSCIIDFFLFSISAFAGYFSQLNGCLYAFWPDSVP